MYVFLMILAWEGEPFGHVFSICIRFISAEFMVIPSLDKIFSRMNRRLYRIHGVQHIISISTINLGLDGIHYTSSSRND